MNTRNVHEWKSTTPEGERREIRAEKFAAKWRIQSKLKGDEKWTYHDPASLEDLMELRDILWRKYQRKRLAWDDIEIVERIIRERGGKVEPLK